MVPVLPVMLNFDNMGNQNMSEWPGKNDASQHIPVLVPFTFKIEPYKCLSHDTMAQKAFCSSTTSIVENC